MSLKTKIVCDTCGKEYNEGAFGSIVICGKTCGEDVRIIIQPRQVEQRTRFDFCGIGCLYEFIKRIGDAR